MKDVYAESYYTIDDLYKAFDMGLETAFVVLENTASLPLDDQKEIISVIKKQIKNEWEFKSDLEPRIRVVSRQKRQS
jgi:hypothetical protein